MPEALKAKKLVLVLATPSLMTKTSKKKYVYLTRVLCIYYPFCFLKNNVGVRALIDLESEVNAIILAYALKLALKVYSTNVEAQKIDGSTFEIFEIVLASLLVEDKLGKARLFQETFLLANTSAKIVLSIPFFTLNNANV